MISGVTHVHGTQLPNPLKCPSDQQVRSPSLSVSSANSTHLTNFRRRGDRILQNEKDELGI